jgi:hypothetical protein
MSFWGSIAGAVIGGLFQAKAAKEERKQAIADQDQQFVRMRDAAQKAGFNPLTALRLTGGQGFTGLPTFSKYAAFGNVAMGITDAFINRPIDKYNKQVRELELEQRRAEIKLTKGQYANLGKQMSGFKAISEQIAELYKTTNNAPEAPVAINENEVVADVANTTRETVVTGSGNTINLYKGEDFSEMATNWFKNQLAIGKISKEATRRERRLNPEPPNRGGVQMPPFVAPESYGKLSRAITVTRYNNARMNEVLHGGNAY